LALEEGLEGFVYGPVGVCVFAPFEKRHEIRDAEHIVFVEKFKDAALSFSPAE
jgi:hypothetical protein